VLDTKPSASTTATASNDAGEYDITVSGGVDDNYSFIYIGGTLTINKADQTITITAIDDKDVSDAAFNVNATTTSGLDLTYAITSGPATINGNTITLTGEVGEVVVEVSQSGNVNYNADTATVSFNVINSDKQDQTITFNTIEDKIYGNVFNLSATASSGLNVSYIVISGQATISDSTVTVTGVGNVTIEANQSGNDNYNPAPAVQQSFVVEKAMLTVIAQDTVKKEGEANPDFEMLFTGFVNGDTIADINELPVATCNADENSTVGTYDIVLTGGSDNNYDFTLINGVLTVETADGISNIGFVNISIYPNPTYGNVTVNLSELNSETGFEVEVINTTGKTIKRLSINKLDYDKEFSVDLSNKPQGVYLLKVKTDKDFFIKKIVKR